MTTEANPTVKAKRPRKPSSAERGQIVEDLPTWAYASRIGGGLTPGTISSIIRQADSGDVCSLIDLANESRQRDAHLQGVLGTNEESIAGLDWQIVPASSGQEPKRKDKKVAVWIEETLRNSPTFYRLLADLAGAIYYGYACSEILWTKRAGYLIPSDFRLIAHRRFRFRASDGKLVQYDAGSGESDLQEAHPFKFIIHQPRVNGDVPHREGLKSVLVWMSAMRNWALGDWLKTGEMSWKPWRIGKYAKGKASPQDVEDFKTVMRRMTTDFSAVIPDSCEINVEWPSGSSHASSTHGEICNVLAQEMSKAVLGQTETTQASTSSGYAQAKVHNEVRKDLRETRAKAIAGTLTRDLIAALVFLNFGPNTPVPQFEFITQDPTDFKAFAEAIATLQGAGARIPERWVYEEGGIPMPREGEAILGQQANPSEATAHANPNQPSPAP